MKAFLLIISAPTGAGKTTIARSLADQRPESVAFSVSATTRAPRLGEIDGQDYFFLTREEFARRRANDEFIEWAEYGGHWYGTLASEVERILASGRHVLLDIEVKGAKLVRRRYQDRPGAVVSVFVLPPSAEVLLDRLRGRASDTPLELKRRLERAVEELAHIGEYDYVVLNDDRHDAVRDVSQILDARGSGRIRRPGVPEVLSEARELAVALRRAAAGIHAAHQND